MSAISTILLGAVAFTNVALVAYLLGDRNKAMGQSSNNKSCVEESQPSEEPTTKVETAPKAQSRVGTSKFNVDEFLRKFEQLEQGVKKMNMTLDRIEGEVKFKDVEFANDEDKPSEEEIANDDSETTDSESTSDEVKNEMQVPDDKLDETFQDARIEDFDGDTVSSPSASGSSIEDIEESVNAAIDPKASIEDKSKAAKVLCPLLDTNLMAAAEEKIKNDILACVRDYLRSEVAGKSEKKTRQQKRTSSLASQKSKSAEKSKREFHISKNLADFNPEDLIPK